MRHLEERVRVQVGGDVAGGSALRQHEHEQQRDLVRDHVADRPPRQPQHLAHGRVPPVEHGVEVHARAAQRREQHERHRRDPGGRARAEQRELPDVAADAAHVDPLARASRRCCCAKTMSTPITITLLTTGANAAATKRRCALSSAVASAVKP